MPEDSPEQCVGPEAEKVGRYLYDTFYSSLAQARHAPARIRLSRLTVRQYENTIADLTRSFTAPTQSSEIDWKGPQGLQGEYFYAHNFKADQHAFQRRDATIDFDFGTARPVIKGSDEPGAQVGQSAEQAKPKDEVTKKLEKAETSFSIRWQGAVVAPVTGIYEFILETANGTKLWVNDNRVPLIDAWVASGNTTRTRASLRLLGGRQYPLRLDLFKHKEPSASIRLKWRPPHLGEEVIPRHALRPGKAAPTLVVRTPFPPDDRSTGYVRANRISQAWDEATTYAALEVATRILESLPSYVTLPKEGSDRITALRQFCTTFAERAFRRPLSERQRAFFVERPLQQEQDLELAFKKALLVILKSPHFLYREVKQGAADEGPNERVDPFDSYDVAAWLAFTLWDSLPDGPLLAAAASGQLDSRAQIYQQAARMVADQRSKAKLHDFLLQWLKLDQPVELVKDPRQYPRFTKEVAADLRTSLGLFLYEVAQGETVDYRQLLLSDSIYVNGRLAQYYGLDLPIDAPFQRVTDPAGQRVGLLAHPYLLARYAYASTSSPIHRGVLIARSLLGRRLMPPPKAVEPLPPKQHADLSTRQRVALQTQPPACQTCHMLINPLGFTLENFDAVGRFRDNEGGFPVDATGSYVTTGGEEIQFWSVPELAAFLAGSKDAHKAFIEGLFQCMINQPMAAFGDDTLGMLQRTFVENQYNLQALQAEIATASVWRVRALQRQGELE
jgi:hypothetical protein